MLYPANPMLLDAIKKEKTELFIREAETARLVSQNGFVKPSWLVLPTWQRIERLVHPLIVWGERLSVSQQSHRFDPPAQL